MEMFSPSPVQVRRWLKDEPQCAMLRLAIPAAGIELNVSLLALPLGGRTNFSLLLYFENSRHYVEYCRLVNVYRTDAQPVDCAQTLQAFVSSTFFAQTFAAPFVAHLRTEGLLPAEGRLP